MNKQFLGLVTVFAVAAAPAFGAGPRKSNNTAPARMVNEAPMTSSGGGSNPGSFLGVTSDTAITGTTRPGMSALFHFNDKTALQVYLAMDGTKPNFGFGVGGKIKFTVVGNGSKGLHLGGGVGLGTTNAAGTFFANILATMGLHFTVADSVMFVADSSLGVRIISGATDFGIGANSTLLGGSILIRL